MDAQSDVANRDLLQKIEQCEDMLHQWLITQHHNPSTSQRTAVLVVRFPKMSSDIVGQPEAHFFFDGHLNQSEGSEDSRPEAIRQTKDYFEQDGLLYMSKSETELAEALIKKGMWVDEMIQKLEVESSELQQRRLRVSEKEAMVTNKYKELRKAMLRAEGLEFQLRQQALELQTRERVLFEVQEDRALAELDNHGTGSLHLISHRDTFDSPALFSPSLHGMESPHASTHCSTHSQSLESNAMLVSKLEAAAAVQAALESEIHRLKSERDSLLCRVEEISEHVTQQGESLTSLTMGEQPLAPTVGAASIIHQDINNHLNTHGDLTLEGASAKIQVI